MGMQSSLRDHALVKSSGQLMVEMPRDCPTVSERFYVPDLQPNSEVVIEGAEVNHITKVMRRQPGDQLILFDGNGGQATGVIDAISRHAVTVHSQSVQQISLEPKVSVTIAAALPKGDRLKFMVEKLAECGANRLIPVNFARSNVVPRPNTIEKMRRYVIEACKQCGRNHLMKIGETHPSLPWISEYSETQNKRICLPIQPTPLLDQPVANDDINEVCFLVGPEGGFTEEETAAASDSGWQPIHFGPRVLRIETAAIFSCITAVDPSRS